MTDLLDLNKSSEYLGIKKSLLDRLRKNGMELNFLRHGRKFVINKNDLDEWLQRKQRTTVLLDREDLIKAFKFSLKINYSGHTRSDFGTARQRSVEQAVENWTQGALAEIALSKFMKEKYDIEIKLDFSVHEGFIVGQEIIAVVKNKVENPPRKRISVKSGKPNGMFLIVPQNEIERSERISDLYFFVRIWLPDDFIFRLFRKHPELKDISEIPPLEDFPAQIIGYIEQQSLKKVSKIPGIDFSPGYRYVCESGILKNSETHFKDFADSL